MTSLAPTLNTSPLLDSSNLDDRSRLDAPAGVVHAMPLVGSPPGSGADTRHQSGIAHPVFGSSVMSAVRVSVVIPTLNEADNLPQLFERLPADVAEVIIVDGHSTDGTTEVARTLCPEAVILTQDGKGKGNALACGFAAATGEVIVMLDADGSTDPAEVPRFVAALLAGADFAKGTRFMTGGGSDDITWVRKLGNKVLSGAVNVLWNCHYSDLCYGYNAFWRDHLRLVNPDCSGFEVETLINIRVARSALKVVEVPSFEACRVHGQSNLSARRDGVRVLRTILAERVRPA
jgi:glycosyltransferase involved in cell wall biosynthesis